MTEEYMFSTSRPPKLKGKGSNQILIIKFPQGEIHVLKQWHQWYQVIRIQKRERKNWYLVLPPQERK